MLGALQVLSGQFSFDLRVMDVDTDAVLLQKYDQLVPVLVAEDRELCHYFLDEAKVREYLVHFR
jgi:hypothetical protein